MNDKPDIANHRVIFKTGKLHELDMASNILADRGIPFYRQEESVSGLKTAMPFQPSIGPGTWFSILVPEIAFDDAKRFLSELPFEISTDPEIWNFDNSVKTKRRWKMISWILIGISILLVLFKIVVSLALKV